MNIKFRFLRIVMRVKLLRVNVATKSLFSNNSELTYRLFTKKDSIEELTKLINNAYKANAEKGMNFGGATQDSKKIWRRIRKGICIIVLHKKRIIATVTLKPTHKTKGSNWYKKSYVAKRNLLAVDPEYQKKGIASHLIKLTEIIAKNIGAEEIAIDTAENNTTLFAYYNKNNYRFIEYIDWESTNYRSVIYSKSLIN